MRHIVVAKDILDTVAIDDVGVCGLCIDRCIGMCIGMCVDMCIDMCIDKCVDMGVDICV